MNALQYELLYRRLRLPLGMAALRLLGNLSEAEDIVQDAFALVWERIRAGQRPGDCKAYLYITVRNLCLNRVSATGATISSDDIAEPLDEVVHTAERDAALWRAVDRLPDRCRTVLLMVKRDGMTYREVADELGISVKTVDAQMAKAMKQLRGDASLPTVLMFF